MFKVTVLSLVLSFLLSHSGWAQFNIDSIANYSDETLENFFEKEVLNLEVQEQIAKEYFSRVDENTDSLRIGKAYGFLVEALSRSKLALAYADSTIKYSINQRDENYPTKAYYLKSAELYFIGKFVESFDNLIIAKNLANSQNNDIWIVKTNKLISNYNAHIFRHDRSVKLLLQNKDIFDKNPSLIEKYKFPHSNNLFNLSLNYLELKQPEKALHPIKDGLTITRNRNQADHARFLHLYALAELDFQNYKSAIDTLLKARLKIPTYDNSYTCGELILSTAYLKINELDRAKYHLKNGLDHAKLISNPSTSKFLKKSYEAFIDYYNNEGDIENEMLFFRKKAKIDSIILAGQLTVANTDKIIEQIAQLESKESDLEELKFATKEYKSRSFVLLLFSFISLIGLAFFLFKSKAYKQKFDKIFLENQLLKSSISYQDNQVEQSSVLVKSKAVSAISDLNEDQIARILKSLQEFEESKKYVNSSCTLYYLAKELDTNKTYLSKVINSHKQTNFANYINNLRIGYILEELKNNPKLRSYTVEAISEECGFNTAQSFSKAFQKRTGLYPSYFIKNLDKRSEIQSS